MIVSMRIWAWLALALLLASSVRSSAEEPSEHQRLSDIRKCTVRIDVDRSDDAHAVGAATCIGWNDSKKTGLLLSAAHVVRKQKTIKATWESGKYVDASVVKQDDESDLVVMRFVVADKVMFASLADRESTTGGGISIAGFPNNKDGKYAVHHGTIADIRNVWGSNVLEMSDHFLIHADTTMGFSGGGTFDKDGKLIGVVIGSPENKVCVGLAVRLAKVKKLLSLANAVYDK